jgi:hypothetical protein
MKFTKEDARKELVGKMTAKGEKLNLSERSISEQLDTLMLLFDNDELEVVDFVDKVLPIFRTADANVRNDVSVGIKAYEEKHPKQEPTQKTEPAKSEGESELEKRILAMEAELAKSKSEKRVATIKDEVITKLKEKGVNDTEWANSLLSIVTFNEEFDVDANVESYVALYNQQLSETGRMTPHAPKGGDSDKALKSFIGQAKAYAEANNLQ